MATHVFSRMAVTSDPELMVSWWPKPDFAMTSVASPRHDVCAAFRSFFISKSMRAGSDSARFA